MKWLVTALSLLIALSVFSQNEKKGDVLDKTGYFFSETRLHELISLHGERWEIELVMDSTNAELFRKRANYLIEEGNSNLALELYKVGHDICKKLKISNRLPVFQNDLAFGFETTNQHTKAVQFYAKAIQLSDSLDLRKASFSALYSLATFWASKGTSFDSLQLDKQIQAMLGEFNENVVLARAFYRLAAQFHYQKEYDYALQFFDIAIDIQSEEKDSIWLMRSYNNKAHTLLDLEDYLEAKDNYIKGMSILEALQPEFIVDWELLQGYHDLAKAFRLIGDYSNALFFLETAKSIWEKSESIDQLIHVMEDIADIYINKGDTKTASTYHEEIRKINKSHHIPEGNSNENKHTGILHMLENDLDKALNYFKKHAELHNGEEKKEKMERAIAYGNIGIIYLQKGKYRKAKKYLKKALKITKNSDLFELEAKSLINLGTFYAEIGKELKAADYYMDAIDLYNQFGGGPELITAMMSLANTALHDGQIEFSLDVALSNIKLQDALRETYRSHADRLNLQQKSKHVIDGAVFCAYLLEKDSLAYSLCQRTKNRLLTDLIAEQSIAPEKLSGELVENHELISQSLKSKISKISKSDNLVERKQLIAERDSLYKRRAILKDRIRTLAPEYANLLYPKPVNYQAVQKVLEPDEVVVEYYFGILRVYALVITQDSFRMVHLEESEIVRQMIQAFREEFVEKQKKALLKKGKDILANIPLRDSFFRFSSQLYQSIWEPLEKLDLLKEKTEIIVIPDDALHYLPFEILVENKEMVDDYGVYDYLIKKYGINYYPSATTLHFERIKAVEEKNWATDFFGLAVQDFSKNDCSEDKTLIANLNFSISEVKNIAKIFYGSQYTVTGSSAKKSFLESHPLTNYRYLHFSTHSLINTVDPQFSRILLHASEDEEACVNLYEIFDLEFDADIISLSSCNSRLGQLVLGEGMIGFTRALMYAGTPTVILSQWNVFDDASSAFFVQYYSKLKSTAGKSKYSPLREVQLDMINSKKYANPYYWASFVLIGEK